jgi:hypothetical protein
MVTHRGEKMTKRDKKWRGLGTRSETDGYVETGKHVFDVKTGLRAVRNLRAGILSFAYLLDQRPGIEGYLILVDPKISRERLRDEWESASRTLSEHVRLRLHLVVVQDGHYTGLPEDSTKKIQKHLANLLAMEARPGAALPRPDYFYVVLKVLIHQWFRKAGPVTTRWLMETAGCTYPTVSKALKRLGHMVQRHSDRRVELGGFPREAWKQLLAVADDIRLTARFIDTSGQPRSPEALLRRLRDMKRNDIGIGGSLGARHWYPDLDLVGDPRLDLSVHCPENRLDLDFVKQLDPALNRSADARQPASLVIHVVRRADPLFEVDTTGVNWADPVECLLDLQEMHLEPQTLEFLRSFNPPGGSK